MKDSDLKIKVIIIVCSIIVVVTIGAYIYKNTNEEDDENFLLTEENTIETDSEEPKEENSNTIMIHVTGEVTNQGVVILPEGARIVDAIEAAGGETSSADLNKLNLAYVLSDGEKIYVPNRNEENQNIEYITSSGGENVIRGGDNMDSNNGIINLNTATVQELKTLPGIGEALAARIIEYREQNGKFNSVEDIKNVSGIGDSKYDSIKDMICVK